MEAGLSVRNEEIDMDAIVGTLCAAFDDDPVTLWNFPRNLLGRDRMIDGFFRATAEFVGAHGHIEATPDYGAVGVWSLPGQEPTAEEDATYIERLLELCGAGAERALTIMQTIKTQAPKELPPNVHVMFVAATPARQSRGAVLHVLQALVDDLNSYGVGIYAEASSQRNLRVWERLGMSRLGPEIQLPGGGPTLYPVWGDPGEWAVTIRPKRTP